jgi:tetratricopeptide (TPR) repeat protein
VLNNLGVTAQEEGDWDEADRCWAESSRAFERAGDVVGAATASMNRGELLLLLGRNDESRALLVEVLRSFRSARYAWGIAYSTGLLGHLEARSGDPELGLATLDEAVERCRAIGAGGVECYFVIRSVDALVRAGRAADALAVADSVQRRPEVQEELVMQAQLHRYRAEAERRLGHLDAALRSAELAASTAEEAGFTYELGRALQVQAAVLGELGRSDAGVSARRRGEQLLGALGVAR